MASVKSPIRTLVKPFLFRLLGKRGYKYAQFYGKKRDIQHRLVEEKEMELLPYFVKPGDCAIDVGANYAYYTDRLSGLAGNEGKVFAFEPIPFTYMVCAMIVKSNKLGNVSLFNLGVSDKNQTLKFSVPKLSYGPISAGQAHIATRTNAEEDKQKYYNFEQEEEVTCDVVALDTFNLELSGKNVSFIKIDIEGAEYFALKGMEQLIKKHLPVILIEVQPYFLNGFNIEASDLESYISQTLGYNIYYYDEELKKLKPLKTELFDANFILIPVSKIDSYQQIIYDK
ncbi:FkbM family methyltransferase [Mucilaginibacter jinjuensis]|uniref:FkbM family methyltransferase n=1 Tax=Mucilaginibacter jinjuensis TaxID=1176721 RepID=A0ABY7T9J5_9SPHI|nr:FkbM family methyltransferase [Mucilaginibacter jinjuensis]WCT11872.1 FkbM family methyltransferase [Mucilaginibacter jinjuensis]